MEEERRGDMRKQANCHLSLKQIFRPAADTVWLRSNESGFPINHGPANTDLAPAVNEKTYCATGASQHIEREGWGSCFRDQSAPSTLAAKPGNKRSTDLMFSNYHLIWNMVSLVWEGLYSVWPWFLMIITTLIKNNNKCSKVSFTQPPQGKKDDSHTQIFQVLKGSFSL